jgi:hypothetical protein
MAKLIKVTIDEKGDASIDLTGFHGKGCAEVSKVFEKLGAVQESRNKTEFNESCSTTLTN